MEEKENSGKRKGFFRSLFEKNHSAASEEPVSTEKKTEQKAVAEAVDEVAAAARLEVKGSLQEAWNRWNSGEEPLKVSLFGDGRGCAVPLTEREMGLERVRISAKIERDAKEYIRDLDRREETRVRIEAQKALVAAGPQK